MTHLAALPGAGGDRESAARTASAFLQGLVSNDVAEAAPGRAVWTALLTPQGKYLADFFILRRRRPPAAGCERAQVPMLVQRLTRFRLRSKVTIREAPELLVHAAWDGAPADGGDRRARSAPARCRLAGIADRPLPANASEDDWDRHRLMLGLPDGTRDLEAGKDRAAGGRVRRAARRVLEQGLLHGPGTDRAHQVSRPGQAPAGAGDGRRAAAGARHAGAARRHRGRHDALRPRSASGWRCCGSMRSTRRWRAARRG